MMLTPEIQEAINNIYKTLGNNPLIRDAKDVADALVAADKEIERLRTELEYIAFHGTDMPSAANYDEADWWRKIAYDLMCHAMISVKLPKETT